MDGWMDVGMDEGMEREMEIGREGEASVGTTRTKCTCISSCVCVCSYNWVPQVPEVLLCSFTVFVRVFSIK